MKDKDIPNLITPLPEQSQELEDNLPMVTYIMLHRIYDLLTIIANKIVSPEDVSKMVQYHEDGFLLGPTPSFRAGEENGQQ